MNAQDLLMESFFKFSTACISDALDLHEVNGGLEGLKPLFPGMKLVGPAYTLNYEEITVGESGKAGDFLDEVPYGSVIVIANKGRTHCTVWGDILTFVAQLRGIKGTVIDGCCRDATKIIELKYPIFSRAAYMKSGKNRVRLTAKQVPVIIGNTIVCPGDIICADDSGVIAIPSSIAITIAREAQKIEIMEENIINDIKHGMSLCEARIKHKYNDFALTVKD